MYQESISLPFFSSFSPLHTVTYTIALTFLPLLAPSCPGLLSVDPGSKNYHFCPAVLQYLRCNIDSIQCGSTCYNQDVYGLTACMDLHLGILFGFFDTVSLYNPGVDQTGLKLRAACLCLLTAEIKGMG